MTADALTCRKGADHVLIATGTVSRSLTTPVWIDMLGLDMQVVQACTPARTGNRYWHVVKVTNVAFISERFAWRFGGSKLFSLHLSVRLAQSAMAADNEVGICFDQVRARGSCQLRKAPPVRLNADVD